MASILGISSIPFPVFATGTKQITLNFDVNPTSDVTLAAYVGQGQERNKVNNNVAGEFLMVKRDEQENFVDVEDSATHEKISGENMSAICVSDKKCSVTITIPDDHGVILPTPGGSRYKYFIGGHEYVAENIENNENIDVDSFDDVQEPFDGKAYLIWSCNGGTCYHYFDNIGGDPMFVNASSVKDDNTNEVFDVNAEIKGFALKSSFERWQNDYKSYNKIDSIDWTKLDTNLVVGVTDMREFEEQAINAGTCTRENTAREDFEHCVDNYVAGLGVFTEHANLQPVGEPFLNNAYVSYGDRNFKITIYNDDYRGIDLGSLEKLHYYPAIWNNAFLRTDSYDVSGTSKENPAEIETVLLEDIVTLKALNYNSFEIKSIEALDVPDGAVVVIKSNGEFNIKFNSNFYDNVVFKITSSKNEVYYLRINRITLRVMNDRVMYNNHQEHIDINASFYFDNKTSYNDYIVSGTISYLDGTSEVISLENAKYIDDGLGNITYDYEVDEENITDPNVPKGKGLKVASYKHSFTYEQAKKIDKVYINVEKAGSTADNYAGAFSGSGKGIMISFEEEK